MYVHTIKYKLMSYVYIHKYMHSYKCTGNIFYISIIFICIHMGKKWRQHQHQHSTSNNKHTMNNIKDNNNWKGNGYGNNKRTMQYKRTQLKKNKKRNDMIHTRTHVFGSHNVEVCLAVFKYMCALFVCMWYNLVCWHKF